MGQKEGSKEQNEYANGGGFMLHIIDNILMVEEGTKP